jgi:transposase-like protein
MSWKFSTTFLVALTEVLGVTLTIKQRIRPMLGFKRFETAAVTIRGIELAEKIKKNQFNLRLLTKKPVLAA